jgi:hypothetical protein
MAVDLKRQLVPTFYCMRSGMDNGDYKLRNWRLEASNDASTWCLFVIANTRLRPPTLPYTHILAPIHPLTCPRTQ